MLAILQHATDPNAAAHTGLEEVLLGLAMLFALCVAVVVVFHRVKMPPVVGFLVAGALMGPHAFRLVEQPELVEQLAEVGVVVLLFTVGMELSVHDLWKMRRAILIGGGLQVLMTTALGAMAAALFGWGFGPSLFLGFLLTLSSTAAVTKLLQDRAELGSPVGRLGVSICVAQDLAIVPMILCIPLLAGGGEGQTLAGTLQQVGLAFLYLILFAVGAWFLVPRVLDLVCRTRSREVFILTVFTLCLGAALTTAYLGLSLALGAFLVGAILAASGYHHQAASEVEPFRDTLSSLFFVSIGMLFDYRVILEAPWLVTACLAAVVLGKAMLIWIVSRAMKLPTWVGLRTALLLAQVGEFSFVLVQLGRDFTRANQSAGFMQEQHTKIFLVVAVMSIAITPLLYAMSRRLTRARRRAAKPDGMASETAIAVRPETGARVDHVIVVGFGPVGQAVARALRNLELPYVVIEMNAVTVKEQKEKGVEIFMGDATREAALHVAGIESAKLLVLTVPDPGATRRTVDLAKRIAPQVQVVARTTYLGEVRALQDMGVREIVPQELETSAEIMVRVLRHYLVPDDEVGRQVRAVRDRSFGIFKSARPQKTDSAKVADYVPGLGVEMFRVQSGSAVADKSLLDSGFRKATGCTVVAIKHGDETNTSVRPDTLLAPGDIIVVLGPEERMADVAWQCSAPDTVAEADSDEISAEDIPPAMDVPSDVPSDASPDAPPDVPAGGSMETEIMDGDRDTDAARKGIAS